MASKTSFEAVPGMSFSSTPGDVATPVIQGMKTAMDLAQVQEDVGIKRQQLELQKETLKQRAMDGAFDMFGKLRGLKPAAQKALMPYIQRRLELAGVPTDPNAIDFIKNSDEYFRLFGRLNADPELRKDPEFLAAFGQAAQSPEDALAAIEKINSLIAQKERQKMMRDATVESAGIRGQAQIQSAKIGLQRDAVNRNTELIKQGNVPVFNPETGEMDQEKAEANALTNFNLKGNEQRLKQQAATNDDRKTDIEEFQAKAKYEMDQKNLDEKIRHSREMEAIAKIRAENEGKAGRGGGLTSYQRERTDQMVHQRNLQALKKDTQLNERLRQYANLSNALATINDAEQVTPQQIDEFQQAVRSNLGIKGSGGVDERSKTYINSLGLNAERIQQFITGDPASIAKDSNLLNHLRDLARVEQANIAAQMDKRISAITAGNKSVYARRSDLRNDLLDAVGAARSQYQPKPTPTPGGQLKQPTPAILKRAAELKAKGVPVDQIKQKLQGAGFALPDTF